MDSRAFRGACFEKGKRSLNNILITSEGGKWFDILIGLSLAHLHLPVLNNEKAQITRRCFLQLMSGSLAFVLLTLFGFVFLLFLCLFCLFLSFFLSQVEAG